MTKVDTNETKNNKNGTKEILIIVLLMTFMMGLMVFGILSITLTASTFNIYGNQQPYNQLEACNIQNISISKTEDKTLFKVQWIVEFQGNDVDTYLISKLESNYLDAVEHIDAHPVWRVDACWYAPVLGDVIWGEDKLTEEDLTVAWIWTVLGIVACVLSLVAYVLIIKFA
eukprot:TRINITY_DN2957_c0_g1_i1.p1 TRINITY_DN2957_c0_g1~~TRINITY_DN2957_c0_g1_i1.p1  ORF type:complete len:171 (+),score=27.13 TRINITY_DN2957_c0_g1_i1:79-591(+)